MNDRTIVLAGGSGFLGTALQGDLRSAGYEVVVLTRGPDCERDGIRFVHWDGKSAGPWAVQLEGAAVVVNLAGQSVNCRYTPENRREIVQSRLDSIHAIGQAISGCARPPGVWIQSASAAIYGDRGDELLDETSPPGVGFSPDTCVRWESAFHEAPAPGVRRVLLRIAFALGAQGGALGTLAGLTRWFLGGAAGTGRQWVSWLHVKDLNRIILRAVESPNMEGLYLVATNNPVRNHQFMRELRRALHRPWSPPVPPWAVRIGSLLMGTEAELALRGRRCTPRRLLAAGFQFEFPTLRAAIEDLYGTHPVYCAD